MGALKYWIWMTSLGKTYSIGLLGHFGSPEAAYAADKAAYEGIPGLPSYVSSGLRDKSLSKAEEILARCADLGIRVLTYQDTEYPERLRQIPAPPCVLYVKGTLPQLDDELAIAMVGARKSTPYGEMTAKKFGMDLARKGALIVSGIARGIDGAALRGAITGGGRVVSVLGNGIDVVYPFDNQSLYEDIPYVGALISEYPPGTQPDGANFPLRNRIIAGITLGTLVVEGNEKSGSLITARHALEQNRDVFAIPGNWDLAMSRGPNSLIQKGEAKLCLEAWDILEEYQYSYPHKIQERKPLEPVRREEKPRSTPEKAESPQAQAPVPVVIDLKEKPLELTDDEAAILSSLEGREGTADDIMERSSLPARRVLSALTMLQVRGLVTEHPGKRFSTPVILKNKEGAKV